MRTRMRTRKLRAISVGPHFQSTWHEECDIETDDRWTAIIKVDYDRARNPINIGVIKAARMYFRERKLTVSRAEGYKTGKGHHLRLWLTPESIDRIGDNTILILQALLGDDPYRQKFNRNRVRRKDDDWNVLWTSKWHNAELVSKEILDPTITKKLSKIFNL